MITNKSIGYSGRLANQMFQYATLISIGFKKGLTVKLPLRNELVKFDGCLNLNNMKWIPYKLDLYNCFNLNSEKCTDEELSQLKYQYNESTFTFNPSVFDIQDFTSIGGYYQSPKYFEDTKKEVLQELKFKLEIEKEAEEFINRISNKEIVSVHVRRTDYVSSPTLNLLGSDYFKKALRYFIDNDYNFLIVSDDIPWCKEVLQSGDNVFFSEGHSPYVDLCMLSKCQHSIIANSSFSWWGAWMNSNPNKKVIAPHEWFRPQTNIDCKDLYCKNWIVI